jgi:hypothetical protein
MIAVLMTPTNPRKVTASPVKFRVEGVISVINVRVEVVIYVELFFIKFTKFGEVKYLTGGILNLTPEFVKHLVGVSGTNVVWHGTGTRATQGVPVPKLAQRHLTGALDAL